MEMATRSLLLEDLTILGKILIYVGTYLHLKGIYSPKWTPFKLHLEKTELSILALDRFTFCNFELLHITFDRLAYDRSAPWIWMLFKLNLGPKILNPWSAIVFGVLQNIFIS